jgi:hypothetical protein
VRLSVSYWTPVCASSREMFTPAVSAVELRLDNEALDTIRKARLH